MVRRFIFNSNFMKLMKVGILGGSFNPAHLGHIHLSEIAIKKLALNQLWWIPTSQNPLKLKNNFLTFEERIKNSDSCPICIDDFTNPIITHCCNNKYCFNYLHHKILIN